jgi:hypothetical protein
MKHLLHRIKNLIIGITASLAVMLASQNSTFAEGTKQVRPDSTISGGSLMVDRNNANYTRFCDIGCPPNYRLYIHIKNVGETILFGLQSPVANVGYNLRRPNGTIAMTGNLPLAGAGYIRYYRNAIQGPFPAFSGYTPFSQKIVSIADTGDWYFEIKSIPNGGTAEFSLFDFQVVTGLNFPAIPTDTINGRVWSQSWQFYANLGGNNTFEPFNGKFFVYSDDGITTSVKFSDVHWGEGVIFCNPVGCYSTGNFAVDRQSQNTNTFTTFPGIAWYKVFLNNPDTIVYPDGQYGRVTQDPAMIDDPNYPVCSGRKYIEVVVNKKGIVEVKIDVPYGDSTFDVFITANVNPGLNHIPWNGLDGHGGQVPGGIWLELTVTFINGLTNLPLWDIEQNPVGYKVVLVRPNGPTLKQPFIYWDDSQLQRDPNCPVAPNTTNLGGCDPLTSICHDWQGQDCHDKMINSWWYSGSSSYVPLWVYYSRTPDKPLGAGVNHCGPGIDTLNVIVLPVAYTADWYNAPTGGTLLLSNSLNFITPFNNATTTYYAETRDPISGCVSATREQVTVTILPLPVMPVTITSNPTTFCFSNPGPVTLKAAGGFGTTLNWYTGSCGTTLVGTGNPLVIPSVNTTTTFYVRWENNCGVSVCNSVTVDVQSDVLAGSIGSDQTVCKGGDPTPLNNIISGSGDGFITYRWEKFSGAGPWQVIAGATGSSYDPPAGLFVTTLFRRISISTLGGLSCESQPSSIVKVSINAVTSGIVGSDQQVCFPNIPAPLTELASASGTGSISYQWQSSTTGCAGPWTDIPAAIGMGYAPPSLLQTTFYHRIVTSDLNGVTCSAVSGCVTISQSFLVASVSTTDVTCSGDNNGSATVNISQGTPGYTFLWNDPQAQTTNPATNLSQGNYSVVISDAAMCSNTQNVTIGQQYPTPSAILTMASGEKICKGDSVTLSFALTGTSPWSLSYTDGTTITTVNGIMSSPFTVKVFPVNSCVYTITALTDAHCSAIPGMLQGSAAVTVYPLPAVDYTWQFGGQNDAIQFYIDSTVTNLPAIGYMVLWNFGDGTYGYEHHPLHIFPAANTFVVTLTVTDTNGCVNSVTHLILVTETPHAFFSSTSPVCKGQPVCFSDLSFIPSPPFEFIKTWIWDFGDGSPKDSIQFPNKPNTCHV